MTSYDDLGRPSAVVTAVATVLSDAGPFQVRSSGPNTVFTNEADFAEVTELRKWADLSFVLPGPVESSRIRQLTLSLPVGWSHTVRLYAPDDVDDEIAAWLVRAYRHVTTVVLDEGSDQLNPDLLQQFSAKFHGPVLKIGYETYVELPQIIARAIGDHVLADVRMSGIDYFAELRHIEGSVYIPVDDVTGLIDGRYAEVTLKVRM